MWAVDRGGREKGEFKIQNANVKIQNQAIGNSDQRIANRE
jgi:hypothetical protein